MHGQQSEERQQQHMWSSPLQRSSVGTTADSAYQALISKGGRTLNIGDCALFQGRNALPYIGILRKVTLETVDKKEEAKLTVNWLYRHADLELGKGVPLEAAPNEIFYSFHKDDISAASLLHPCKVAFLRKGVELPEGVSSFVCRRVYDTASKCLWWLTDRDYTNEHQDEVDQLLDRTKLEMQVAVQSGGPSPRVLPGPTTSQALKVSGENAQVDSYCIPSKGKKRERCDQNSDPSKRERNVKLEDADVSPLKRERSMKPEELNSNLDKDGGLFNIGGVERLVQLMQQDQNDGTRKVADVASRRTMLAGVIASTEKEDCLTCFLQLGGLRLLDEWLQEAHKGKVGDAGSPKEGDKGVEDLLIALLRALDRLPVDLEALKTCIVGKSVNHLRSHKNLDIQKKARKLVDVWKKRVDTEMKASGEPKSGAGHGISWSYKQSPSELVHSLSMKGSGGPAEVAVKSSGAFAGSAKAAPNMSNSGDGCTKGASMSGGGKTGSPTLPVLKENNSKQFVGTIDTQRNVVKEEKSSSSSHSPSNGHSWGSGAGKSGSMTWKDEVKNVASGPGNSNSKNPGGGGSRLTNAHNKGQLGTSPSGGSKEVGKPLAWSRNVGAEKAASPAGSSDKNSADLGSAQQRLLVRIPNPGRSPARTSGVCGDTPGSRSSSPSVSERLLSASLADMDGKRMPEPSLGEGVEVKIEHEGKVSVDGKTPLQEGEKLGDSGNSQRKLGNTQSECMSREPSVAHPESATIHPHVHRSPEGCAEREDVGKKELGASTAAPNTVGDGSQPSPMEVDEGAMSLLATVAAAADDCIKGSALSGPERGHGSSGREIRGENESLVRNSTETGPIQANGNTGHREMEVDGGAQSRDLLDTKGFRNSVKYETPSTQRSKAGNNEQREQGVQGCVSLPEGKGALENRSEEEREGAERVEYANRNEHAGKSDLRSSSPDGAKSLDVQDHVQTKLSNDRSFPKEYKINGRNGLESKMSGFDGHMNSRFGKREVGLEERNLSRTHSRVGKSAMELCNGLTAGGGDYRSCLGFASLDARMQEEKEGKRRGQEVGQPFGRRGDAESQRLSESTFPEEDVVDLARQAAEEAEQIGKSNSSSERDGHESRPLGMGNGCESREPNIGDTARRDNRRMSVLHSQPNDSGGGGVRDQQYTSSERDGHESRPLGMGNGCESREPSIGDTARRDNRRMSVLHSQPNDSGGGGGVRDQQYSTRSLGGHVEDSNENAQDRLDKVGKVLEGTGFGDGEEVNQASSAGRVLDSRNSVVRGQENDLVSEIGPDEVKSVDDSGLLSRASSLRPAQAEGGNTLSPVGSQLVLKPTTPQQAAESSGPSDTAVGGSDVSERPDFDLNEGFTGEDSHQDDAATPVPCSPPVAALVHPLASAISGSGVAAPIAVLAATKGSFIPPASPMRMRGELGWKGSAATSAFRPAEPRRTPDRQNSNAESLTSDANLSLAGSVPKQGRPLLEFDLNVADDRVMEDVGAAATTLSSQGSVLGMSMQNHSLPSSSVSGITYVKQDTPSLTFLKPESSSSAHPLSNGGNGPSRVSHGQGPSSGGQGVVRPNLDLDLNRMDDSEESGPAFLTDLRAGVEGVGSSARSNNSTTQVPRRMMDFDLNDGLEEAGVEEAVLQSLLIRKPPPGNNVGPSPMAMSSLRMGGETMSLSPWYPGPTSSSFPAVSLPSFPSGRAPDSGYHHPAGHSFLNGNVPLTRTGSPLNVEMYRPGPQAGAPPAIVYPPPQGTFSGPPPDRMTYNGGGNYIPFPVFGNSPGYISSSAPFTATSGPYGNTAGALPFPGNTSQLGSPATMTTSYTRPAFMMDVGLPENNGGAWSRPCLDLNAGPEAADNESVREDMMHVRLPPLHPGHGGVPVFTNLPPPVKRKEPEGGWNLPSGFYGGGGGYKQTAWR